MPLDRDPLPDALIARLRAWVDAGALMPGATESERTAMAAAPAKAADPDTGRTSSPCILRRRRSPMPAGRGTTSIDSSSRRLEQENSRPRLKRQSDTAAPRHPRPHRAAADRRRARRLPRRPRPDAYDRVVDRLLASPAYGERWARPWLDLARYADTNGYEKDNRRSIWQYRDWVIDALNRDMPFDQFTIEQIAGDMLPNATHRAEDCHRLSPQRDDQRGGRHRSRRVDVRGPRRPRQHDGDGLARINAGVRPVPQPQVRSVQPEGLFRLLAFFANTDYESRTFSDGTRYFEARLDLATPEQEQERSAFSPNRSPRTRVEDADNRAARGAGAVGADLRQAEASWVPLTPMSSRATNDVTLTTRPDGSLLASGPNAKLTSYVVTLDTTLQNITGLKLEALPDPALPRGGPGRDAYGHFRVTGSCRSGAGGCQWRGRSAVVALYQAIKVDDSAYPFEAGDLLQSDRATTSRKGGSWAINAMRDSEQRLPRQAVLAASAPFGYAGGTGSR